MDCNSDNTYVGELNTVKAESNIDIKSNGEAVKVEPKTDAVKDEVRTQNQTATDSIQVREGKAPETRVIGIFS
ncbi:hypothetical protein OCB72_27465 [Bacillus cereus]|nr:hypothetical protein [Bacillus cereus]